MTGKLKVLHVASAFAPAKNYGGPTESVFQLCRGLAAHDCTVRVLTTNADGLTKIEGISTSVETQFGPDFTVRYCNRVAGEDFAPTLFALLPRYVRWADVVHITPVYCSMVIPALLTARCFNKVTFWSPRGQLQRWEGRRRVRLKAAWERICRIVAPQRLTLHATSEVEAEQSLDRMPAAKKAVMIPNGVQIPEFAHHRPREGALRLLFVGRVHEIKGLENLLDACAHLMRSGGREFVLTIGGGGEASYMQKITELIDRLELRSRVTITGWLDKTRIKGLYENADLVVLPSHLESFAMVLAEALACGVPVIASRGTPWRRVEEIGCGLWVDNDPQTLASAIRKIAPCDLRAMGERGRQWMQKEFSWDRISGSMAAAYRAELAQKHAE